MIRSRGNPEGSVGIDEWPVERAGGELSDERLSRAAHPDDHDRSARLLGRTAGRSEAVSRGKLDSFNLKTDLVVSVLDWAREEI